MISIIIPCYNVEKYLFTCINSILKQTYQNFEIICVDDNSTDSTLEIIKYFQIKSDKIKLLENKSNKGPGFSRNRGMSQAKGDYIFFLDSDDWISKDTLEKINFHFEQENVDIILFKNLVYYDVKEEFGFEDYYEMTFMDQYKNKKFNPLSIKGEDLFHIPCCPWNKCYSKKFLTEKNIKFTNENLIQEDNPFYFEVMTKAEDVFYLYEYLYIRRRNPCSIMTLRDDRLFDNLKIAEMILKIFLDDEKLYSRYKHEVLNFIFEYNFKNKYYIIDKKFKENIFKDILKTIQKFDTKYGIKDDILTEVNPKLLKIFELI